MSAIGALALAVTAMGIVVAALATAVARAPAAGIAAMLELWTAGGLLKLQDARSWRALAATVAIVALRKLLGTQLHRRSKPRAPTMASRGR